MSLPPPAYAEDGIAIHQGDSLDVLRGLPDDSVHAVITDPPYALTEHPVEEIVAALTAWLSGDRAHAPTGKRGFMSATWDGFVPPPALWDEVLRVLKPGGHLLCFSAPRTVDLMGIAIRLAGPETRDAITWLNGQSFPKSLDVSRAIDKAAGATREVVGRKVYADDGPPRSRSMNGAAKHEGWRRPWMEDDPNRGEYITTPATEDARRWQGWGTGLKPSSEIIIVARKPFPGNVAANVLTHGTGGINIDACRVAYSGDAPSQSEWNSKGSGGNGSAHAGQFSVALRDAYAAGSIPVPSGRWPTNTVLSHLPLYSDDPDDCPDCAVGDACADGCVPGCPVAELDAQSGYTSGGAAPANRSGMGYDGGNPRAAGTAAPARVAYDTGTASRFFPTFRYEAKAPTKERPRDDDGTAHSTVKPLELVRWLVRLVTPPGGTVLDPFLGSGTTAEACLIEGFDCIGVERDSAHVRLIAKRLSKPIQLGGLF